ncbi:MAG TPA: hypothetical protein VLF94_04105 [Chlamydiales bacterium]|nr:hypothetical protein [Chlamydiales bacterium]
MKVLLLTLLTPMVAFCSIDADYLRGPTQVADITYEWLTEGGAQDHDTHHVRLWKEIFSRVKNKSLLEFGLGYSTKYFLDHCKKVTSVDIITYGYGPGILKKLLGIYSGYSNWIPIAFFSEDRGYDYSWAPYKHFGSGSVYKATSYQGAYRKNYAEIDNFYQIELNHFVSKLVKYNKVGLAFVGHAICLRGDIVQIYLSHQIPVIVSHNSENRHNGVAEDMYGLSRVVTPDNYEEIYFPLPGGTTAWIMKTAENEELIDALKKFASTI